METKWIAEEKSEEVGKAIARRLFAARGNHTEVHLRESELALACKLAVEVGIQMGVAAVESVRKGT